MKYIILLLIGCTALASCKSEQKTEVETQTQKKEGFQVDQNSGVRVTVNGITELSGEFIYYADAAVLQTKTEVYGVTIDSMMHVLQDKVKVYKKETTDMVPVTIKGKIVPKADNEEGWPFKVEIQEILNVYEPQAENNNVIKLEKQTK